MTPERLTEIRKYIGNPSIDAVMRDVLRELLAHIDTQASENRYASEVIDTLTEQLAQCKKRLEEKNAE
tara:strand:+ start:451 stop:654 length:204 start_codon:yes stop_codon:yes gene_type:complete